MQKKYLVLNSVFAPVNPYLVGFKQADPDIPRDATQDFIMDEAEAKKLAEFMAQTNYQFNQKYHVVEIRGLVKARVPIEWVDRV